MNMDQIRARAREIGVAPGKLTKIALVKTIQRQEGNFDCFATAQDGACDQTGCLWREDCLTVVRKGHAS